MSYTVTQGDVLTWAEAYTGAPYHALLSDPPYHLTEITKRFGGAGAAPAQFGRDGAFSRLSRGFMGKAWDGGDIAFRPETWASITRHLYPGAFGMAFASSRGWHRMAVAMEGLHAISGAEIKTAADLLTVAIDTRDWALVEQVRDWLRGYDRMADALRGAGLIIHPVILCWTFGSGFPKATKPADQWVAQRMRAWLQQHPDAAAELAESRRAIRAAPKGETAATRKAYQDTKLRLQEAAGLTRVVGQRKHAPKFDAVGHGYREKDNGFNSKERDTFDVVEYLDPVAAALAGHRYGLQALKPALEPVIVFQKPYAGRPIDNIVQTGAGALWVDGGRLQAGEGGGRQGEASAERRYHEQGAVGFAPLPGLRGGDPAGRWPANLALVHHPACNGRCHENCPVRRIGEQSGERPAGAPVRGTEPSVPAKNVYGTFHRTKASDSRADDGTAARFFLNADWFYERLEQADGAGYFAKASKAEREAGLDPAAIELMRAIAGDDDGPEDFDEALVDDGRETSIDNPYQRGETERRNTHPTIKPLGLTRWLATLLLPPVAYAPRRLLVPFAGTGSEVAGGMLAGWEQVDGHELGEDHVRIAAARLAYWRQQRHRFDQGQPIKVSSPRQPRKKKGAPAPAQNLSLFADAPAILEEAA